MTPFSLSLRTLRLAAATLAMAGLLTACGGNGDDDNAAPPDAPVQPTDPAPQPQSPQLRCAP